MGFESRAISARVTKQIVTIFSKTCDNSLHYIDDACKYSVMLTAVATNAVACQTNGTGSQLTTVNKKNYTEGSGSATIK